MNAEFVKPCMYIMQDGQLMKVPKIPWEEFQKLYNIPDVTDSSFKGGLKKQYEGYNWEIVTKIDHCRNYGKPIDEVFDYFHTYWLTDFNMKCVQEYQQGNKDFCNTDKFIKTKLLEHCGLIPSIEKFIEDEDKRFREDLKRHKAYKRMYVPGIILWMTICFWLPILIGMIDGATTDFSPRSQFLGMLVVGFEYLCLASFTFPVTLPASFIMAVWGHPRLLRSLLFNKDHPYNESLMNALGHSKEQENQNAAAVTAGTIIGKIKK